MTVAERGPSRPMRPVVQRLGLGLLVMLGGGLLAWREMRVSPLPGLAEEHTPLRQEVAGAKQMRLSLAGDRTDISVRGLEWPERAAFVASTTHRQRNRVEFKPKREGDTLSLAATLNVQPLDYGVVNEVAPLQHKLETGVARWLPLYLNVQTYSGDLRLDLQALRVRSLEAGNAIGVTKLTVPERESGPLTLSSDNGPVTITGGDKWRSPSLRVNTSGGQVQLALAGARVEVLNIGTLGGSVGGQLPVSERQNISTGRGNIDLTVSSAARGTLDVRSEGGRVVLRLPRTLGVRLRYAERHTAPLPQGLPRQGRTVALTPAALEQPTLDIFIDARGSTLRLTDQGETP